MLIKILLFMSIAISALTLWISESKLKDKINVITTETKTAKEELEGMTKKKEDVTKKLTATTDDLDKANTDLKTSQEAAKAALDAAAAEVTKTAAAQAETKKANDTIVTVKQSAQEFFDYGKSIAEVKKWEKELPLLREGQSTATAEMRILAIQYQKVKGELDAVKYKDIKVILPEGLRGKVVVVDPKWDFVVLDIGASHGVKQGGELYIDRGGKLVGKVQVITVEANHCIANIVQSWKKGEVQEGDVVKFSP